MKLLKLSSDNPKFKTLNFKSNLNIVAGLQLSEDDKETFNGIGKSLTLTLVQLMFGGKLDTKNPKEKRLKEFLSAYGTFYLHFTHNNNEYIIKKDFDSPKFYINDKLINQKNYRNELNKIFKKEEISFRNILNSFARRYGGLL